MGGRPGSPREPWAAMAADPDRRGGSRPCPMPVPARIDSPAPGPYP